MKHIRKYNESIIINKNYFNLVFADFIDDGSDVDFGNHTEPGSTEYWEINIDEPILDTFYNRDIDYHLESINAIRELNLDIKSCIDKVKDEYPNLKVFFSIRDTGENNSFVNTIKRFIIIRFEW